MAGLTCDSRQVSRGKRNSKAPRVPVSLCFCALCVGGRSHVMPQASRTRPGVWPASHWVWPRVAAERVALAPPPQRDFESELTCVWGATSTSKNEDQSPRDVVIC